MKLKFIHYIIIVAVLMTGCKKFIAVPPPYTQVATTEVFKDPATATTAQLGVYLTLESYTPYNISRRTGTYADELTNYDNSFAFSRPSYIDALTPAINNPTWTELYALIYQTNVIVSGLEGSSGIPDGVKKQLMGEAKFSRAFCFFYLVNLFGDVPMPLKTDYKVNSLLTRSSKEEVFTQIIADLKVAEANLSADFVDKSSVTTTTNRVRPTKWAAEAMLARVYLYLGDYKNALGLSSAVIDNNAMFSLNNNLDDVFLKDSNEAIWQLESQTTNSFYQTGYNYIISYGISTYGESNSTSLSPQLLNAFESGDQRRKSWVAEYDDFNFGTVYYPFKYKQTFTNTNNPPTQNETVLRLAEQYLIRAEARTQQGDMTGAIADLNIIRRRAGLEGYAGIIAKSPLLDAILHERQVELFTEWGNRWLDLKRTDKANSIMTSVAPLKGGTWSSFKQLWPIPLSDINKDPNLTQNTGY
jgi:hypothetical protein